MDTNSPISISGSACTACYSWASRGDLPASVAVLLVGDERPKKLVERLRARLGRSKMDEETVGQLLV